MGPKKKKPIAKCRFLFERTERGWGEVQPSTQVDYGSASWATDQSPSTVPPPRHGVNQRRPSTAPVDTPPRRPQTTRRSGRAESCTLVFRTLEGFEGLTEREATAVWPDCKTQCLDAGKVSVVLKRRNDVVRALELRSVLGIRLLVRREVDFFTRFANTQALLGEVRRAAGRLPWWMPLQCWALLTADRCHFDPDVEFRLWFPPPTFDVSCNTADGGVIENYGHVAKAFTQGFQQVFQKWPVNPNRPDFKLILEFDHSDDLTFLLEVSAASVIVDPFLSWTPPLKQSAMGYALLTYVRLNFGDVLLNASCSVVDVSEEVVQHFAAQVQTVVCDAASCIVEDAVAQSRQWCARGGVDGAVCTSHALPFRENVVDAVICASTTEETLQPSTGILKRVLQELARVCRLRTGRVCLLTDQDSTVEQFISRRGYWSATERIPTGSGPFKCTLFAMQRSERRYQYPEMSAPSGAPPRRQRRGYTPSNDPLSAYRSPSCDSGWDCMPQSPEGMDWTESL